jgi:uracil-DNA glycosylase
VTDDFFTNLILMLVAPVIVVVGGLLVTEYLRVGIAIKILLAVISFGFAVLYGVGLFMAIYEPSARNGEPSFWAPFTGLFLISTFLLLRRPVH